MKIAPSILHGGTVAFALTVACSNSTGSTPPQPVMPVAGTTTAPVAGASGMSAPKPPGGGSTSPTPTTGMAGRTAPVATAGASGRADDDDAGVPGAPGAGTGAGGSGGAAGGGSMSKPLTAAEYGMRGPYTVKRLLNVGMGTISGGTRASIPSGHMNDPSAFTLYFPENAKPDEKFPLLTFGNGTYCSPTFYDELIGHVVSYGFVVIATNTSSTGSAEEMLKGVDWAIAQSKDMSSPIFGKVDGEHVGAFGHSQGGAGTCRAGVDPRIKAIAPLSGTTGPANIKCPSFFVTTGGEAMSSSGIENAYNAATTPSVYGVTMSGNHDEYTDVEDDPMVSGLTSDDAKQSRAAVAAWFEWQLKGKSENKPLFTGDSCGFCSGSTWKTFKSKGF